MSINKQIKKKNLAPDSVDGSKVKLLQDQTLRGINHLGQEVDLLKISQSGKSTTQGKEIALQEDLASEQVAREAADAVLTSAVSAEVVAREVADSIEATARIEGDESLQANLVSAETGLIQLIEKEELRASTAEALTAGKVDQEIFDRVAGDSSTLAESKSYTDGKISLIIANTDPAALDSLSELVSAFENADSDLNESITSLAAAASLNLASAESSIRSDFAAADASKLLEAKSYTDSKIAEIPEVDLSALEASISALQAYSKNIVHVDAVNGVDEIGRGSLLRPFKTINFAYSQVPSLGNPSNTSYNANVGKFVTEKLIIDLAPGRYTENVVLGFKRARVQLRGEGATIIGDVKTSVKLADFPCAALENMKASLPAPFTGTSAFMNIEISGNAGGGLESDPTSGVFVITGQASLAFEESTVAGFGTGLNWDSSHGQFYASLDSVSVGNWVVTSSYTANMARALPAGVIEVDSSNIAASSATYRMFFGAVPYSYLTDFATWNVASKGAVNKAPNSGLTLKAHNSTFGNVIGPSLTLGEVDGCRIYDIDRTMRGTVDNGSIIGSTSTSLLGFVNNQFRIFSGSGDLASAYKLGQAVGATRYKMDSVSHTTMSFNRSSSGVLTARVLDLGAGVSFDFLDDARSISVADPATNYTRSANTVDASLEGIDTALGLKASSASVISGNASSLAEAKAYTDTKIAAIPSVDLSSYETIANVDSKDAAKLVEAKAYADQVSSLAQDNAEDYTDSQIAAIPAVDLSNYYITSEVDELIAGQEAYSEEVADNALTASIEASKAYTDAQVIVEQNARIAGDDATLFAANENTEARVVVEQNARIAGDDATLFAANENTEARVVVEQNARIAGDDATLASSQSYTDAALVPYALISDVASIEESLQATQEELSQVSIDVFNAIGTETTRAMTAESALSSRIDNVISNTDPAFLDSLSELVSAFESADSSLSGSISALSSAASSALGEEIARATAAEAAEKARAEAAESVLTTAVSSEAAIRAAADSAEKARAEAAESVLTTAVSSEAAIRAAADSSEVAAREAADASEQLAREAADASEQLAREAAVSALQSSIDDLDVYAQDIRTDVDALDVYAQDIRSDLDSVESRVSSLEAKGFSKGMVVVGTELAFVDLDRVYSMILSISAGRLAIHEGEDYTVSVVAGKTRLTFIGSLLSPGGAEAVEQGDRIYFSGTY